MIDKFIAALLPSIEHFHLLGYWVGFFAALLETALVVGIFLPGSTLLLLLGALAASGQFDFGDLLWFAIAGAVLGDNVNYWLGQKYGSKWTRDGIWFLTPDHLEKARRFFDRHGAKSVLWGRFIPSVKEIAPFVAGTVGMRHRTFLLWNILGAIGWGLQWVGGGYLFGQSLKLAQTWMSRAGMALVLVLAIWALLWLFKRFVVNQGREIWRVAVSLGHSIKEALEHNRHMRRLIRRYPRSVRFLANRVNRSQFNGLPLTVLCLAFTYVLLLFAGIVEDIITSDPIVSVDHAAAQLIASFRAPSVLQPFVWITSLGEPLIVGSLLLVMSLLLWFLNRKYAIVGLLISCLGASLFTTLGKLAFQRPRPIEAVLIESSYSFPSGHATGSVAFYGFMGYLLIRSTDRWKTRVNLFFATGGLVLLIGLSRIVLDVHYLSDVWAGYLVGALWLIIGISVTEWLSANNRIDWNTMIDKRQKMAVFCLLAIATIGITGYASTRTLPVIISQPETITQIKKQFVDVLHGEKLSRTANLLGEPEQPLTFAIVAQNTDALITTLNQAGWVAADKPNPQNILRLIKYGLDYKTAPIAPAFWNDQINDLAFEKPEWHIQDKALATIRIWKTSFQIGQDSIFVGVARQYDGIRWGIIHSVSPDIDAAAEQFVKSLGLFGKPSAACQQSLFSPTIGKFLMGNQFFARGHLWLLDLRDTPNITPLCESDIGKQ